MTEIVVIFALPNRKFRVSVAQVVKLVDTLL